MAAPRWVRSFINFYRDGFRNNRLGKTLWLIVIIKLFIMFGILRLFFFPNFLNTKFDKDEDKASYVNQELIDRSTANQPDSILHH